MKVQQIYLNFGPNPLILTVGEDGVRGIHVSSDTAVVMYEDSGEQVFQKPYVVGFSPKIPAQFKRNTGKKGKKRR